MLSPGRSDQEPRDHDPSEADVAAQGRAPAPGDSFAAGRRADDLLHRDHRQGLSRELPAKPSCLLFWALYPKVAHN